MTEEEIRFKLEMLEKHTLCIYKMLGDLIDVSKAHGDAIEILLDRDQKEEA